MSNRATVGTVLSVTADGNTFFPAADADPSTAKARFENAIQMSSGRAFLVKTRQDQNVEGMTLKVTSSEMELLLELNDRIDPFPLSYKNAAEDVYRGHGWIAVGTRSAQSGNVDVILLPDENGWTLF